MSDPGLTVGYAFPDHACGVIDADRVRRYAETSGDDNPIHTDDQVARGVGLEGTIIQGMLLMALADEALAAWRPQASCRRLTARFARPAMTGTTITVAGRVVKTETVEGIPLATLRIFIRDSGGVVVAMAEAVLAG